MPAAIPARLIRPSSSAAGSGWRRTRCRLGVLRAALRRGRARSLIVSFGDPMLKRYNTRPGIEPDHAAGERLRRLRRQEAPVDLGEVDPLTACGGESEVHEVAGEDEAGAAGFDRIEVQH